MYQACRLVALQAALRKMIIELILATDMQKHVAIHTALQTRLAVVQAVERAPTELKHSMGSMDGRSFKERHRSLRMSSLSPPAPSATAHQVGSSEADRLLLLQVLLCSCIWFAHLLSPSSNACLRG